MVIGFEVCLKDVLVTSSAMTLTTIPGSGGILSFLVGFGFSGFEKCLKQYHRPIGYGRMHHSATSQSGRCTLSYPILEGITRGEFITILFARIVLTLGWSIYAS